MLLGRLGGVDLNIVKIIQTYLYVDVFIYLLTLYLCCFGVVFQIGRKSTVVEIWPLTRGCDSVVSQTAL